MSAAYAVLNSYGEAIFLAPTREQCERYIATQSASADCCEIRAYPFPPCWDGQKLIGGSLAAARAALAKAGAGAP